MTQERIQTRYTLNGPLASHAELEQAIARAIEAHKQDLFPLLERLVDVGDNRVKLSQKDPAGTGGGTRRDSHRRQCPPQLRIQLRRELPAYR